jgi:predicted RNA-binding Zn ribbon-like protein
MQAAIPEVPDGPLTSGAPFWYWLGGRPALDYVNTLRERWRRRVECLACESDLAEWLIAAGLLEKPVPVTREVLQEARELREGMDLGVQTVLSGAPPPHRAVLQINRWLPHSIASPVLVAERGRPVLRERREEDPLLRALGRIALDAARMLGTEERSRVRVCASPTCSARFFDRSPAARRRWCSMRVCGNVAKARRHRAAVRDARGRQLEA